MAQLLSWDTLGKYVVAGIFILQGALGLLRDRHGYGGWSGDFFDGNDEVVLGGPGAALLNGIVILMGLSALAGFGWFLLSSVCFLIVRKLVVATTK